MRSAETRPLGIAIGIAAMIAVAGISESSRAGALAELDQLGTNLLAGQPGQTFGGQNAARSGAQRWRQPGRPTNLGHPLPFELGFSAGGMASVPSRDAVCASCEVGR